MIKKVIVELEVEVKPSSNTTEIRNTIEYHVDNLFKNAEVVQIDIYDLENENT